LLWKESLLCLLGTALARLFSGKLAGLATMATDEEVHGAGEAQLGRIGCQKIQVPRSRVCISCSEREWARAKDKRGTVLEILSSIPSQV
jgi:hypothetical protein